MILVDTSVWIDYFRGVVTPQSEKLLVGEDIALQAARNFRKLRALGITIISDCAQGTERAPSRW